MTPKKKIGKRNLKFMRLDIDIEGEGRVINIYVMKKVVNKVSLILYNPIKKEVRYLHYTYMYMVFFSFTL
jgi:hypothetical protein